VRAKYCQGLKTEQLELFVKSIILWLCGVPVVVIIGLKLFGIL
jgi:hypothetical protein